MLKDVDIVNKAKYLSLTYLHIYDELPVVLPMVLFVVFVVVGTDFCV